MRRRSPGDALTIAGAPTAITLLDPTAASATVSDSIVLGDAPATVAFTRTDRESAPAALFVNAQTRNFRLRPGSPALDRGQITAGESKTDVDGQPRTLGKASDLGADELDTVAPRVTVTCRWLHPVHPAAAAPPRGRAQPQLSSRPRTHADPSAGPAGPSSRDRSPVRR